MSSKPELSSPGWRWLITFVPLVLGAAAGIVNGARFAGRDDAYGYPWGALAWMCGVLIAVLVLLEVVARVGHGRLAKYGWYAPVIGADGRMSTSKTQFFGWTLILVGILSYMTAVTFYAGDRDAFEFADGQWANYLLLLGIPAAAAVGAKAAVVAKADAGTVVPTLKGDASTEARGVPADEPARDAIATQAVRLAMATSTTPPAPGAPAATQPSAPAASAKVADVVSDDKGEPDLADTQYLLFNVVTAFFVIGTFVSGILDAQLGTARYLTLPEVPGALLGLTGASAATYTATKALQRSSPKITAVTPGAPSPLDVVQVLGANLVPAGTTGDAAAATQVVLTANGQVAAGAARMAVVVGATAASAGSVTFTVPAGLAAGSYLLEVRTAGATATEPYPLTVT